MKLLPFLLVSSLAVNAALVGMYMKHSMVDAKAEAEAVTAGKDADAAIEARTKATEAAVKAREGSVSPQTWEMLRGSDLTELVGRLRAAGFPPSVLRAIVSMQAAEKFAARQKELTAKMQANIAGQSEKYWSNNRGSSFMGGLDAKTRAEYRALNEERSALLKSLLGPSEMDPDGAIALMNKRQYGHLPPEKLDRLQRILTDYNDLRSEVHTSAQGLMLPEDREQLAFIDKEQQADLDQLLTPEERFEYDIRSSNLANQLRSQASGFEFTEAEFRNLFAAVRATAGPDFSPFMAFAPDHYRQRMNAQLEAAKAALSPERYADYQLAADPQYSQANRLVTRLNLPPTSAKELVMIQQDAMRQAGALRANRDLTNEQRTTQLATLSQETTKRLSATLGGDRGVEAYKLNGGQWIQMLNGIGSSNNQRSLPSTSAGNAPHAVPIR